MKLSELVQRLKPLKIQGNADVNVLGVDIDSRKVQSNHLFIAVRGTQADGHNYIGRAIEAGASAVVCEQIPESAPENVTFVQVDNSEQVVGEIATTFFGRPSEKVKLVGVTGTNGKTTIATTLYNLFRALGYKCGLLSTVCNYIDGTALHSRSYHS